ncbi:NUDIX domain-containing protein [Mesorhizobium sp. BAC0120]|uniref:NUDIX domain-containing protein n=1 Tax=Mesorhizobium sp. BAC0120 TaxID=3090670 RepID=UPI00298D13EA|nr:NUDIX domain-containing protein [Mesorhizobium sp. BAC0120]MDW6022271.1 NUDIX domain-containing protein [Mesorhizobium sp. BAC0120]
MSASDPEKPFKQTGWPGLRAKLFHTAFLIRRPMTLGVRAAIHDQAKQAIFLIRHTYVPGWHFPGGGVERDETAETALEREVREECDIALIAPPVLRSVHFNRQSSPRDHVLFYLVSHFRVVAEKKRDREIAEARFFPIDRLPEDTTPATRRRLAELFDGAKASAYW